MKSLLTVNGQKRSLLSGSNRDLHLARRGKDDGFLTKRMSRNGGEDDAVEMRRHNRAPGRKRIRRGPRRGCDNESIGDISGELAIVHRGFQRNHASKRITSNRDFIQEAMRKNPSAISHDRTTKQHSWLEGELFPEESGDHLVIATGGNIGKKSKSSHVDEQKGCLEISKVLDSAKQAAVTPKDHDEIVALFEVKIFAIHRDFIFLKLSHGPLNKMVRVEETVFGDNTEIQGERV